MQVTARVRPGDGADGQEIEEAARALRDELLEADRGVDDVRPTAEAPPAGAKPGDPQTWETLAITLAASGGVLTTLITLVGNWLGRQRPDTTVVLTVDGDSITLPAATAAERAQLVAAFTARHGAAAGGPPALGQGDQTGPPPAAGAPQNG